MSTLKILKLHLGILFVLGKGNGIKYFVPIVILELTGTKLSKTKRGNSLYVFQNMSSI
jgi:hypothetical protein